MKSKAPTENPQDVAARQRERRASELERSASTQQEAAGLTSDLRAVYGLKGLFNQFATPTTGSGTTAPKKNPQQWQGNWSPMRNWFPK